MSGEIRRGGEGKEGKGERAGEEEGGGGGRGRSRGGGGGETKERVKGKRTNDGRKCGRKNGMGTR